VKLLLERNCSANAQTYSDLDHDRECTVGGIISDIKFRHTRRNERMAQIRLEDLYGSIPITFFPAAFKACERLLVKDKTVFVKGKASHRERITADEESTTVEVEILGESITPINTANGNGAAKTNGSRAVHIRINGTPGLQLETLKSLLANNPGESPVYFHLFHCGERKKVSTPYKVDANPKFVSEVERVIGNDVVRIG